MKKIIFILILLISLMSPAYSSYAAENNYSHLYISVGDAIMQTKADNWAGADEAFQQLKQDWVQMDKSAGKEEKAVTHAITETEKALKAEDKTLMLKRLTAVSNSLVAYDKAMNPIDHVEERQKFKTAITPPLQALQKDINNKDGAKLDVNYKLLLSAWNKKESIVREQSVNAYGQIETKMGFLRIAILKEDKNYDDIQAKFNELSSAIFNFANGVDMKAKTENHYSLQTLIDLLDVSIEAIHGQEPEKAIQPLEKFLSVWPSVEGEVMTRNGALYKELESNIPLIAGKLSNSKTNKEALKSQLSEYKLDIQLIQKKNYTFWDAALVMLREGIEALLIISALIAFLRKTNNGQFQKWIWLGAFAGIIMSVAAAILINAVFSSAMAGANREIMEGITGIIAVIMMLGVGIWLHQKSNIKAWNGFINKTMGSALSKGSIFTMAFISFLSIFREGAETIIFYVGMAPSISPANLFIGILVALAILLIFTVLFIKFSTKMPITPFFKVATIFIYLLAFKILGMSLHALQLTNVIKTKTIKELPVLDFIGFFPTWETIISQMLLLVIIVFTVFFVGKKQKQQTV
ncbi:FTR1 family protein [Bacillus sp. S/N-304-OC-R1]|uniref:FTR1 family iron permease n=1 Tax=Bacillus sp. S/N-304-OC-R1 TaxID=2758034 RepID=UPI001C8ED7BC|nr:FTR1 family protein [Bacillus sp. S/N-304-OC-R1]MBY0121340.1 FTR1 family protein [Bacillus sp. S/N-304-OC-R1]